MSRDVQRDSMKKLTRSNSNDDIHLRPMATLVHSKPTSHGAGEGSFGARDDGSSISSSNEYVAPSPYQNTSSAIAVSFFICIPQTMTLIYSDTR
jgi:hypothetical protein